MMFKTHFALGFLIGLLSLNFINTSHRLIFVFLIALFSSLPDIDHPKSKIGRKFFFISWPIHLIFKHRGFFHSIFPAVILFLVLYHYNLNFLAFAVSIGYISHLIGDAVTKEGIALLHPLSKFRIRGPVETGAILEGIFFISFMVADVFLAMKSFVL